MPEGAIQEGLLEIGIGRDEFKVLNPEQELPLVFGIQQGAHFEIRTRIQGLDGGKPGSRDPDHLPRTVLNAYDENGERRNFSTCGFAVGYEAGEDYDELPGVRITAFSLETRPAFGERIRIVAEVIDQCGRYASNEVWVVASE